MKTILIALFAVAVATVASAQTLNELVAKLPDNDVATQRRAIVQEARTNAGFYEALKAASWTFEGVTLPPSQVVALAFRADDYAAIDPILAARHLSLEQYKRWSAAKVIQLGETIAAYDWLQEQRLNVVQAQPKNGAEKDEYLATVAAQVIAAAKAKSAAE